MTCVYTRTAVALALAGVLLSVFPVDAFKFVTDAGGLKKIIGDRTGVLVNCNDNATALIVATVPALDTFVLGPEPKIFQTRISPDGAWVVYAMGILGDTVVARPLTRGGAGRIVIGKGYYPNWWVDPSSRDTFVTYCTEKDETQPTVYKGFTVKRKIAGGQVVGPIDTVLNQGFKCRISWDGRWIGTAIYKPMIYDLKSGQNHPLTTCKIATGSTVCNPAMGQACHPFMNPTVDPARMDQITYFNILHDTLLTMNSANERVWAMAFTAIPDTIRTKFGLTKWHSGAWSNMEDLMFTGARDATAFVKLLVRRSDYAVAAVCLGAATQDMWFADAPRYSVSAIRRPTSVFPNATATAPTRLVLVGNRSEVTSGAYDVRGAVCPGSRARRGLAIILQPGRKAGGE